MNVYPRRRLGFTAIEIVLTIGVLGLATGLAVPMYRQYIIRNDLEVARQNVAQGIQRAKFLSQVAMNDAAWGFSTDAVPGRGVLFMGTSYAGRDAAFDELYTLPSTVQVSGITEVHFTKIMGTPNQTGIITLTALNGEQRTINISIGNDGNITIPEDWLDVCVDPYGSAIDIKIPDSLWQYYQEQGAILGLCAGSEGTSGGGGTGGGSGPAFTVDGDTITPSQDYTCTVSILGTDLSSDAGYDMPITMRWKFGGGWDQPFGDWNSPTQGNVNDGMPHSFTCGNETASTKINVDMQSWIKKKSWFTGDSDTDWKVFVNRHTVLNDSDFVEVVTHDDDIPDHPALQNLSTLETYVQPYVNLSTGKMEMATNQALYLVELGTTDVESEEADFQDLVMLITIDFQ